MSDAKNFKKRSRPHLKIWNKPNKTEILDNEISNLMTSRKLLNELDSSTLEKFSQFPLSEPTRRGLKAASFFKPTAVQKKSLKYTLLGKDVIVQAKTGSGKTLAFVIPVLEYIYTEKISSFDGPIAVILTPTRELAKQIFAVFQRVGKFHNFTMIDIMGGKTNTGKREEWQRAANANIVIGTPGRFAQHQRQNPSFDMSNLHFLILDEVDRLLDPTFRSELISIANNLSSNRHCMLFSATFSKNQCDLSALGLNSPVLISTESSNVGATPANLKQAYSVVPLGKKLDHLWTFLQSHCKKKIIVFFSTQKQVRFVHDLFTQMRPYFSLMQLRGNMLQSKRFKIYERFSQTPRGAVLFATNVAERGLDFPEVDWVVQFDCPKQLDDYVHRVGRTARAERQGRALMFLLPSEVRIIKLLSERNVQLRQIQIPESRIHSVVTTRAPAILASKPELAESARIAFGAYLRDYCFIPKSLTSTKESQQVSEESAGMALVFKPGELPVDEFAASLGLALVPELPKEMLKYMPEKARKPTFQLARDISQVADLSAFNNDEDKDRVDGNEGDDGDLLQRKAFSVLRPEIKAKVKGTGKKLLEVVTSSDDDEGDSDEGEKLNEESKASEPELPIQKSKKRPLTRIQQAKKELRRKILTHTKVEYDAEGKPIAKYVGGVRVDDLNGEEKAALPPARLDIEAEREKLHSIVDVEDKARWRAQIRAKHRAERNKAKEERKAEQASKSICQLNAGDKDGDVAKDDAYDASGNESNDGEPPTVSRDNSDDEIQDEDMGDLEYCEESAENDESEEEEKEPARKHFKRD